MSTDSECEWDIVQTEDEQRVHALEIRVANLTVENLTLKSRLSTPTMKAKRCPPRTWNDPSDHARHDVLKYGWPMGAPQASGMTAAGGLNVAQKKAMRGDAELENARLRMLESNVRHCGQNRF